MVTRDHSEFFRLRVPRIDTIQFLLLDCDWNQKISFQGFRLLYRSFHISSSFVSSKNTHSNPLNGTSGFFKKVQIQNDSDCLRIVLYHLLESCIARVLCPNLIKYLCTTACLSPYSEERKRSWRRRRYAWSMAAGVGGLYVLKPEPLPIRNRRWEMGRDKLRMLHYWQTSDALAA